MTKVSVCCSVLNQSEWLREMIASVVAQTFTDWELIVVDDGSTEDIAAVVAEFKDERIKFHKFEKNLGIPHGINFAFRMASGEYVKPMAADEKLWQMALGLQATYLDNNPRMAACFGLPEHGELGLRPEHERYAIDAQNRSRTQWLDTLLNLKDVPLGSCNALWRRSLFEELGYFDDTGALKAFVDHEWYCRLVRKHDIHVLPYRVASFRDDPNAISVYTDEKREDTIRQLDHVRKRHGSIASRGNGLVTVGIPVKDMAQYVGQAIKSVLAQTYQDLEIIVVDDGSTDGTPDVVRELMNADPRIHLVIFPENKGQMVATNYAIDQAKGEYFVPLSADDVLDPTHLARTHEVLDKDPLLEFCSTQTDFITEGGQPFTDAHPFKQIEKATNKAQDEWKARLRHGNVYFGAGMYRTQALRDVGGWKQEYGVIADYAMYLELLQRANIHVIEEPLTHTRITGKNISTNFDPVVLRQTYSTIKKRFYLPRRKLIIATPFYSVSGFSPYIYALQLTCKALTQAGLEWEYWHPSGDAYVQRVKNTIFSKFIEDPEATDLLMIDSDMEWDVGALLKMLSLPEDLIVGSYPQKNSWHMWTSRPRFQKNEEGGVWAKQKTMADGSVLIEGEDLAGGFVLVKRAILERYMAAHPDLRYIDESADPSAPNRVYTEFFSCGPLADGNPTGYKRFWGEDRMFSRRLAAMNESWWIFANISFGHWGMNGWSGNFGEHLEKMRSGVQTPLPSPTGSSLMQAVQ
jgi:glycosyltransferase involved in cell wall biosynthesis